MTVSPAPYVSVVIPCYRSGEWLGDLASEVIATLDASGVDFEMILVNDGSPDVLTWPSIQSLAAGDARVVGIDLLKNVGQFPALMAGLAEASGEYVVTMDDDFQHPPTEIPSLLEALDARADIDCAIGLYDSKHHSAFRNLGSYLMDVFYRRAYGKPTDLRMSSFRAMRKQVVEGMLRFETVRPVPGALLLQTTRRVVNVPVKHDERAHGSSGYQNLKLVSATAATVLNASTAPLRFISISGIVLSFLALLAIIYYLILALIGRTAVAGFTTIVLLVIFFGGAILLAVGLLGEYVARLVVEAERPPLYLVRSSTRERNQTE